MHWKDWCWSWSSNTLATWCKELTHWKRPWCWERLKAGGEGDDRGWDGWMASPTQWTWVWVNSGSWWWIGRPGVLQSMGSQRVGHDWETKLELQQKQGLGKLPLSVVKNQPIVSSLHIQWVPPYPQVVSHPQFQPTMDRVELQYLYWKKSSISRPE